MAGKDLQKKLEDDNQTTPENAAERDADFESLSRQVGQFSQKHGVAAASDLVANFLIQTAKNYEAKTMEVTIPQGQVTVAPAEIKKRILH